MSRIVKKFKAFGVDYKSQQFSAVNGLALLSQDEMNPTELLSLTEVKVGDDWFSLSEPENINLYLKDIIDILPPLLVLNGIQSIVTELSFGFLNSWSGVKVPRRFLNNIESVTSENSEPMITHLVGSDIATLRELEEYYSLEDAFKMFDIMMVKSVNEALANEEATKTARSR